MIDGNQAGSMHLHLSEHPSQQWGQTLRFLLPYTETGSVPPAMSVPIAKASRNISGTTCDEHRTISIAGPFPPSSRWTIRPVFTPGRGPKRSFIVNASVSLLGSARRPLTDWMP